ncbi:hypothetical protein D3C72_1600380 [compost metagenome]
MCNRQRLSSQDALDEQRDDAAAASEDISISHANEFSSRGIRGLLHDPFLNGFGHPHDVDRLDRLVRAHRDHGLDVSPEGCQTHVFSPVDVGEYRLEGGLLT